MKLSRTSDVSEAALAAFANSLSSEVEVAIDERVVVSRSAEPPSWILLIANADWWVQAFSGGIALYVVAIINAAGKDTWQAIARKLKGNDETNTIEKLASEIEVLRTKVEGRTELKLGLPYPDDYWASILTLEDGDSEVYAMQLALFIRHVSQLQDFLKSNALDKHAATGVLLRLLGDGALEVSWIDRETFKQQKEVLKLPRDA